MSSLEMQRVRDAELAWIDARVVLRKDETLMETDDTVNEDMPDDENPTPQVS